MDELFAVQPPLHPEMRATADRVATYRDRPTFKHSLARAGFFYRPQARRFECFQCGAYTFKSRIPVSAWTLHCVLNADCPFVRLYQSKSVIHTRLAWYHHFMDELKERTMMPVKPPPTTRYRCVLCREAGIQLVYLPCSHISTCLDCGAVCTHCPTCQERIQFMARVYFP